MPIKLRADYPDIVQPRQSINHFKKSIHEVFPFLLDHVDGLEVMFRESEMMVATLHTCIDEDVPAWPLHDCIFVRKSDTARATEIIKSEFSKLFGFKPTVTLDEDSII